MMKAKGLLLVLPLTLALAAPAAAQQSIPADPPPQQPATPQTMQQPAAEQPSQTPAAPETQLPQSDAGQLEREPLQMESKEGFWGKLNPFARKKYVKRQLSPIVGRVNELDELTAANAKMIRDVDARTQEGIRLASAKATEADTRAVQARQHAELAHQTATQANTKLQVVEQAVENVDRFERVTEVEIRFRPGHNILSSRAKEALDEVATPLRDQKGYIIEVQGFSSGKGATALENSQRLAESVVRYLVLEHNIPVYRIHTVGMGNAVVKATEDGRPRRTRGGRVEITLLRNSIADLNQPAAVQSEISPSPTQKSPQGDDNPER